MCGLTGAFGPPGSIDPQIIRTLMILNQDRGRDAAGFFNNTGDWLKINEQSTTWLKRKDISKWLKESCAKCWAVCGHTRGGTRGGNLSKNAHPFTYGAVTGSHNGVLDCPNTYTVDSEYAIDLLSKSPPGEYQQALKEVEGWYVLTWLDRRDRSVYLLNWEGDLHAVNVGDVWYYSSSAGHLATATGQEEHYYELRKRHVWRVRYGKADGLQLSKIDDNFSGKERKWQQTQRLPYNDYLGPRHGRYAPFEPDDYIIKTQDGLWRCILNNGMLQLLNAEGQAHYDHLHPAAQIMKEEWYHGIIDKYLVPITPQTPLVGLPDTFQPQYSRVIPAYLSTYKTKNNKPKDDDDTKIEHSKLPTEAEQEAAILKAEREQMDCELAIIRDMNEDPAVKFSLAHEERNRKDRFRFLVEDQGMEPAAALVQMQAEGCCIDLVM